MAVYNARFSIHGFEGEMRVRIIRGVVIASHGHRAVLYTGVRRTRGAVSTARHGAASLGWGGSHSEMWAGLVFGSTAARFCSPCGFLCLCSHISTEW